MVITQTLISNLSFEIIGAAIEVHKNLGPGLLESVYEDCLFEEIRLKGIHAERQVLLPVVYKNRDLGSYFRIDILVENQIIVELKAVETMIPLFDAQLLSYLKLSGKPKGLLVNFNSENITKGLKSFVSAEFSKLPP